MNKMTKKLQLTINTYDFDENRGDLGKHFQIQA